MQTHLHDDVNQLLLQAKRFPTLNIPYLVAQIQARQKAKNKLPEWTENLDVFFPKMLSLEQSSSEITAKFKASLVKGETLLDLTGGMGIDLAYMSKGFNKAFYAEQNNELLKVTQHNYQVLGIENIQFIEGNSETWLKANETKFSWIYLDPHRRDDTGNKVVKLQDCEPNILEIKSLIFERTDNVLLKVSPMLDIDLAILELKNVSNVYIVAVENEVKEILFYLQKDYHAEANITAINFLKQGHFSEGKSTEQHVFTFQKSEEKTAMIGFSSPQHFLYEPNSAILKSGAFRMVAQQFGLQKIAPHSHLYTSEKLVNDFQGRTFQIKAVCKLDKKEIVKHITGNKANITIRNFPLTVKQIREKLKLNEGGDDYLFATTDAQNQKIVIVCSR
ncbi:MULTISPECIES: THUMP-like domain-containing protein [unclassified Arcicella]|uniref:class I SAM-dependent methyltransferase n=1 Tax=unclassified Arcicella TaxID=2644986 RepID=UPI002856F636|nr:MULTISPECIES: RsmD family RNA methyltransferase [unclassified Arcicella]MDR6562764.1 16S rRNA G966 N2-methylase RsmD [Arcicella sp. BE51]MDR6812891.1 16S rRNA G966 N2-methylase RsmD [Arcicella sp. BE140]MDR6824205.1 16S rRNA G966 N2-methylase RsmD [Arcicella sp. BE139]